MGLFDSNSNTSSVTQTTTTTTNTVDNSIRDFRTVIQNDISVDAINAALKTSGDIIRDGLRVVDAAAADNSRLADNTISKALNFATSSNSTISSFGSNALNEVARNADNNLLTVKNIFDSAVAAVTGQSSKSQNLASDIVTSQTTGGQSLTLMRTLALGVGGFGLYLLFKGK